MPSRWSLSRYKAFFSLDAAFAFLFSAFLFALFSSLLLSSAKMAKLDAYEISKENLAIRFSSFAIAQSSLSGNDGLYGFVSLNEIDEEAFSSFDIPGAAQKAGASYASIKIKDADGKQLAARFFGQKKQDGVYCATRLVIFKGELARLEACIS